MEDKKSKTSLNLEGDLKKRLMRIAGRGLMKGVEVTYKSILVGALNRLSDDELLDAAIEVVEKEENMKSNNVKKERAKAVGKTRSRNKSLS